MTCPNKSTCKLYSDNSYTCNYHSSNYCGYKRERAKSKSLILGIIFSLTLLICLEGVLAVGTYPAVDPNMVLYYHFNATDHNDTTVFDSSLASNNGTLNNTEFQAGTGILEDGSFYFNGINSSIKLSKSINLTQGTISLWIKPNELTSSARIFQQSSGARPSLYISSTGKAYFDTYNGTNFNSMSTDTNLSVDEFVNIVATWGSDGMKLYYNGFLEDENDYNGTWQETSSTIYLGSVSGTSNFYNGSIDEFLIYNYSLSDVEVLNLYYLYLPCGSVNFTSCEFLSSYTFNTGTYYLDGVDSNPSILANANNIVIDGNDSTIYYNTLGLGSYGIYQQYLSNVTFKNFNFIENNCSKSSYLIYEKYTNDSKFINNNVVHCSNSLRTIRYDYSNNFLISENNINSSSNDSYMILLQYTQGGNISYNNLYSNGYNYTTLVKGFPQINNLSINYNNLSIVANNHGNGIAISTNFSGLNVNNNNIFSNVDVLYSYGIYLGGGVGGSTNNKIYDNFVNLTSANRSYGISLESVVSNTEIYDNVIYTPNNQEFTHGYGIKLDTDVVNNTVYNNYIKTGSTNGYGLLLYYDTQDEINLTNEGNINNLFYNNVIETNNAYGIYVHDEIYNHHYGNRFTNNSVYSNNTINVFLQGANNIFSGNIFNSTLQNIYFSRNSTNNSFYNNQNLLYIKSNINSINYFYDLISSLFTNSTSLCNGSTGLMTGNVNITLNPNEPCYLSDNFNLTEGITREHSPIWFSSSTNTEKHVASNLTNPITIPIHFNVATCESIGAIRYKSDTGAYSKDFFPSDYSCNNNVVTLTATIEHASGSGIFTIEYGCNSFQRAGYLLVMLFASLILVLFCSYFAWNSYQEGNLTIGKLIIFFILIVVSVTLWLASGQILGDSCGTIG